MSQLININAEYRQWVPDVCGRFRNGRVKAAVSHYSTYNQLFEKFPQVVGKFGEDRIWQHINGWSRAVLLSMVELDGQEPLGKAIATLN